MSALAAVVLAAGMLSSAEQAHTVVPGESAGSLAKKYYGNKDLGDLLLRFNGKPGKVIHPGEKLTIPSCTVYRAKAGDSWSVLAKRHLGRAGAAPVLAELNGHASGEPLRAGTRIVLPVVLHHTLTRGETLSVLAERYYGDPKKAAIVKEFSRIDDAKRLAVGTVLEIPLVAFVRPEPAPPAEKEKVEVAVAPPPPPPPDMPKFDGALAAAGQVFTDGEYDRARETLESLRESVARDGSVADRREWSRLMAFVYIALDRDRDACAAYRSSPPLAGPPNLDPDLVSPRIRTALTACLLDSAAPAPQISPHAGQER